MTSPGLDDREGRWQRGSEQWAFRGACAVALSPVTQLWTRSLAWLSWGEPCELCRDWEDRELPPAHQEEQE